MGKDQYCRAAIMNVSGADEALRAKLTGMGVDLAALDKEPCSIQVGGGRVVLVPCVSARVGRAARRSEAACEAVPQHCNCHRVCVQRCTVMHRLLSVPPSSCAGALPCHLVPRHLAHQPTHPLQVVLFPYGEDKEYIDEYKRYKGPINVTDFKEYVFKNIPDLTMRLDSQESISAFIHKWVAEAWLC